MVARLRAQAFQVNCRAKQAEACGNQLRYEQLHREWCLLMKRALAV